MTAIFGPKKRRTVLAWVFWASLLLTMLGAGCGDDSEVVSVGPPTTQTTIGATPGPGTPAATASQSTPPVPALKFKTGANEYTITVDGEKREFIVYVPKGYRANVALPLVFMFHGSNQSGRYMFENSGWRKKADKETILAVFPTALKYPLVDEAGLHTKWSAAGLETQVKPGREIKDDLHFVDAMLAVVNGTWTVDSKRTFASGFSNGGGFVLSRLMVQRNTVFGAFATSGVPGFQLAPEGEAPPSAYLVMGTKDQKIADLAGLSGEFPFLPADVVAHEGYAPVLKAMLAGLKLAATYDSQLDPPAFSTMTYDDSLVGAHNELKLRTVKGMGHIYSDGDKNGSGLVTADLFWEFFLKHPLP